MSQIKKRILAFIGAILLGTTTAVGVVLVGEDTTQHDTIVSFVDGNITYNIPRYNNKPYISLNNGIPVFEEFEVVTEAYEEYSDLDSLGRCTLASAIVCKETMPKQDEKRGSIDNIKPTGWIQAKYDNISGKYLYNRCHLIGWQLTAENANKLNLITGTKYLNIDGMLPIENKVAKHIKDNGHYVAYQVTPIYNGSDLLPLGVQMEIDCISCNENDTTFNVFCYNVQPGIDIDYKTGASKILE